MKSTSEIDCGVLAGVRWMAGPVLFVIADGAATLLGQAGEYWAGGLGTVEEINPIGAWLLGVGPAAFAGGMVIWIAVVAASLFLLPWRIGRVVACAVLFGHGMGLCSWLIQIQLPYGVVGVVLCLLWVRKLAVSVWNRRVAANPDGGKRLGLVRME